MASGDSPAVARRRVRLAVRQAREAMDLTQTQVAEAMEWSLSKVMRIENGEVTISPNDLRPLLNYLGLADPSVFDKLVQDAKVSRRRQMWWDEARFREHLTPPLRQVIQYEAEATAIRHFHSTLIPGPLQTRPYAEAILNNYREDLREHVIDVRLEARMRRRDELFARNPPPEIYLLLDESVVYRRLASAPVFSEQLTDLLRLSQERRLMIRVMPFVVDAPIPLYGAYDIYNLPGEENDAVMYRESHLEDELVEDRPSVSRHRGMFEQLWKAALDESSSTALIENSAKSAYEDATIAGSSSPPPKAARPGRRRRTPG